MTLRPPRELAAHDPADSPTPLEYEIAQEKAAALGRLGRALERALAALHDFDHEARRADAEPASPLRRAALVAAAGHALWLFVVQREACGLRDMRHVIRDYGVPPDVQHRMGAFPPKTATKAPPQRS
jgi:hypothetical protein